MIDRRRFLRDSAVFGLAAAVAAACGDEASPGSTQDPSPTATPSNAPTTAPTTTAAATTTTPPPRPYTQAGWLAAENQRAGTSAWRIETPVPQASAEPRPGWIEGYADTTSARPGDDVTLRVSCNSESWHAEAYRMGWYRGELGRLVWTSDEIPTPWQFVVSRDKATKMTRAEWTPSLTISITDEWPPGSYLIKLVSDVGEAHYVPLTVRDDSVVGSLAVVSAVTTWQAYNPWGGCSLYRCYDGPGRSTVVSFDRPYAATYNWGSADYLTHELPLIALIEELGIDTAYFTNIDLHTSGSGEGDELDSVLNGRTALLSVGHDEYYSTAMRATLERARDRGINLAFFGANAVYRHIRLEPNTEGLSFRQMPNYRRANDDPITEEDPMQSTVQWRNPPLRRPESALIGVQYFAAGVKTSLRVVNPKNWVFEGVKVRNGTRFKRLVSIEADGLGLAEYEPDNLEVLAANPVKLVDGLYDHAMTYYAADSGAGVFATGTIAWILALDEAEWDDPKTTEFVRGVTTNVLTAFAAGPAGRVHPSTGNASRYRNSIRPPESVETAES
ncbi:MAG: hypothetical protein FJW18_02860 [Actinobacteria bacterium]|nr:hypothetical protein [Actinomycetota bacterium]